MSTGTDRPLAFWLDAPADDGPEPWCPGSRDTLPAPPPSAGRYSFIADRRHVEAPAPPPASRVRACRQTDPCITPPPGSDRMGAGVVEGRVTVLPPPWAPVRPTGGER